MSRWMMAFLLVGPIVVLACRSNTPSEMRGQQLRCEYLENPLGIDNAKPRLSWKLTSSLRGQRQTAYQVLVASNENLLARDRGDLWDTGRTAGGRTSHIEYSGKPLESRMRCFWKVRSWDQDGRATDFSLPASWSMGLLKKAEWEAHWIRAESSPQKGPSESFAPGPPPPYFRKTFQIDKPIARAFVYVTARGIFELRINGSLVSEDLLAPEWTDYNRRIQYRAYDIGDMLKTGRNALGAVVADGWYSGYVGMRRLRGNYGLENCLLLQLEVEFEDGTRTRIITDETWLWSEGPIRTADLLMGQDQDARKNMPGWDRADFDDSAWRPVRTAAASEALLVAQPSPPVRIIEFLEPVSTAEPRPGVFVFDLGQNISGWARLKVNGKAGDKITMRFAERLNPDGTIYTENLRSARATDTYICAGGGDEVFEPRFTFHGFQYVEVTGYPGSPRPEAVTGCAISTINLNTGTFSCSEPMVDRLFSNLLWSQRGNYLSIPTDCPQRDERLGWMGDAQIFIRTGSFNQDTAAFFLKFMQDVEDAQSEAGAFPDFAPRLNDENLIRFEGAPAWGDAGVIIPWTLYRVYGDTRIIEKHWDAMERWMGYMRDTNPDYIRTQGVGNNYGDWLSIRANTPKDLLATAYWAHDAQLMSRMAAALGRDDRAAAYTDLFQTIRRVFQAEYVKEDGRLKGETQTGYLLALAMDLLPAELRDAAASHLVADIAARGGHLSTGFVGCGFLNSVLTEAGHVETAYRLLLNDTFPSWGYSIRQGATSIWERWDGWTEENGFQNPGMNSFNHYAFGAVGEWLYRYVAGIDLDPDIPGYTRFRIRPFPGSGLTWAKAEYDSLHGLIKSGWAWEDGGMILELTVPANTSAVLHVPCSEKDRIEEGGVPAAESEGVTYLRKEGDRTLYEVASGSYRFTFPWKPNTDKTKH